jgi:GNAT superfamily N-acetyltransferase
MELLIRALTEDDLDAADEIFAAAYGVGRGRAREVSRYLELQPDGWVLATLGGRPVGLGGAVDYGPCAYIGMIGVLPEVQRRGIGLAIMRYLLDWLDARGCPTVLLDASAAGAPLYERLGFVDDDRALLFRRDEQGTPVVATAPSTRLAGLEVADMAEVVSFDAPIYGAPRAAMLGSYVREYAGRAFVARDAAGQVAGYLIAREAAVGPWAARSPTDAAVLLAGALELPFEAAPTAIVPASNEAAAQLVEAHGFRLQRALRHMRRGIPLAGRRALLYGQASFAVG